MAITLSTIGQTTPITTLDGVYGLALHYARQIIEGAGVTGKYNDFDKSEVIFGAIIQDIKVKLTESITLNPSSTELLAPNYTEFVQRYFGDWEEKSYHTEIRESNAKNVVMGQTPFETLVATIINNLDESETHEANEAYKKLFSTLDGEKDAITGKLVEGTLINFADGGATGFTVDGGYLADNVTDLGLNPTDDAIYTTIRNVVKDFQFVNSNYSGGYKCEARADDIRILVPFRYLNEASVVFLSNLFQIEKADMMGKIIETDGLYYTNEDEVSVVGIIITEVDALGRVTKSPTMHSGWVKEHRAQGYTKYVDEMYYFNPAEKSHAIVFNKKKVADTPILNFSTIQVFDSGPVMSTTIFKFNGQRLKAEDFIPLPDTTIYEYTPQLSSPGYLEISTTDLNGLGIMDLIIDGTSLPGYHVTVDTPVIIAIPLGSTVTLTIDIYE